MDEDVDKALKEITPKEFYPSLFLVNDRMLGGKCGRCAATHITRYQ